MAGITTTNFVDSNGVDLGKKLVTKDYLLEVYGTILESSGATGLVVTPELWGWGNNAYGKFGTNNETSRSTPVTTFAGGTNWKQVSGGQGHTAAIKTDGSLWTWGRSNVGQLGINQSGTSFFATNANRSTPVTTFAGGNDWKQVSGGYSYTAAIKTDGSLWTWGWGSDGRLGTNDTTNRSTPVTTFAGGNTWKQVSAGRTHTTAIKTDGSLWTWGDNDNGQLGVNDNTPDRLTPVTTFAGGTNWKQVACGDLHTVAIKTDGSLWVWGFNHVEGRLGINLSGLFSFRNIPVTTFAGGNDWKSVDCGQGHTAAIKTDGSLWVWGLNDFGQLGINNITDKFTPVTTFAGGTNWKQVSAGRPFTTAIKTDGTLWTWGRNDNIYPGVLGTNDTITRSTPVTTFAGGNNWKQVSAGAEHIVAIQTIDYI